MEIIVLANRSLSVYDLNSLKTTGLFDFNVNKI